MYREDIVGLVPEGSVCIELGVAKGEFAELVLSKYNVTLYGVDRWGDHHNEREYQTTTKRLQKFGDRSIIIRKTFDEALLDFSDEYFDLIYIDGYAHTGQQNGKTLEDWYPKLKKGGVFSGDDYVDRYNKTIQAVDAFTDKYNLNINLATQTRNTTWSKHPSWYTFKP